MKKLDLTGQKYGRLTVLYPIPNINGRTAWHCQCECGNYKYTTTHDLRQHRVMSCGCLAKETSKNKDFIDLTGQRFGKLVVLKEAQRPAHLNNSLAYWECLCDCGNHHITSGSQLRSGKIKSCGCTKSWYEYEIINLLINNSIPYKKEYIFSDLKDKGFLRFDFAILNGNEVLGLIEYNGEQHYNKNSAIYKEYVTEHDIMKRDYCLSHNIPLLVLTKENYSQDKILDWIKQIAK